MAEVCVLGGGPAGSSLAARLAQLGHAVTLIERAAFPRARLGESLSPGVLPLLDSFGARAAVETAGFRPVRRVRVRWEGDERERVDPEERGLLVDRGRFDALLLEHARAQGVRVLQPAAVRSRSLVCGRWHLRVGAAGSDDSELRADLLADAGGRAGALPSRRRAVGPPTVALYAYWRGPSLPDAPRIEAGGTAWYWGVPLPDGSYNTLAFVDRESLREARGQGLEARFAALLARSTLLEGCDGARRAGPVMASDATPFVDDRCVTERSIKVGDAALALDPLSSSGVQKAIQTALAAAVVANTLVRRPEDGEAAARFYRDDLERTSMRHRAWAASHYARAACDGVFWRARAAGTSATSAPEPVRGEPGPSPGAPLELARDVELVDCPCIDGDFVAVKRALRHRALDGPLAYLGGVEVAPLLTGLRPGMTCLETARAWSDRIPLDAGLRIAGWLHARGILVPRARG